MPSVMNPQGRLEPVTRRLSRRSRRCTHAHIRQCLVRWGIQGREGRILRYEIEDYGAYKLDSADDYPDLKTGIMNHDNQHSHA